MDATPFPLNPQENMESMFRQTTMDGLRSPDEPRSRKMDRPQNIFPWGQLTVVLLYLLYPGHVVASSSSSSSSSSYHPYRYDQTGSSWTPDGRLLQMEYAQQTETSSTPVVWATLDEHCHVMITIRRLATTTTSSPPPPPPPPRLDNVDDDASAAHKQPDDEGEEEHYFMHPRLLILPLLPNSLTLSSSSSFSSSSSSSSFPDSPPVAVLVALAGVLPDAMALLQQFSAEWRQRLRTWGLDHYHALSLDGAAAVVARILAQQSQTQALGGGLRPWGATVVVAGFRPTRTTRSTRDAAHEEHQNDDDEDRHRTTWGVDLWRTDPSGALGQLPGLGIEASDHHHGLQNDEDQSSSSSLSETATTPPALHIILGGGKNHPATEARLQRQWAGAYQEVLSRSGHHTMSAGDAADPTVDHLEQGHHDRSSPAAMTPRRRQLLVRLLQLMVQEQQQPARDSAPARAEQHRNPPTSADRLGVWVEVVLLSTNPPCLYKLSQKQVRKLLREENGPWPSRPESQAGTA